MMLCVLGNKGCDVSCILSHKGMSVLFPEKNKKYFKMSCEVKAPDMALFSTEVLKLFLHKNIHCRYIYSLDEPH